MRSSPLGRIEFANRCEKNQDPDGSEIVSSLEVSDVLPITPPEQAELALAVLTADGGFSDRGEMPLD